MITSSNFRPAWWLRGPHAQTLWPNLLRRRPRPPLRHERLELSDGDFLDLVWTPEQPGPLVVVLHGLEGSVRSPYAAGILSALHAAGMRGVLMHFRGCSGEPNRLARGYHSGETGDLNEVVQHLRGRYPAAPLAAIGYSLGGNVLLKWLGEQGETAPLYAAVAVSVPLRLDLAAQRLERGLSRLYQWHLLTKLKSSVRRKYIALSPPAPVDLRGAIRARSFRAFDDALTAPLHGFRDAADYYARSSSRQYLRAIQVPTLIVQATDDPFLFPGALPPPDELSPSVTLELSPQGGHVGFVAGRRPWAPRYWLEERIPDYLRTVLPKDVGRDLNAVP